MRAAAAFLLLAIVVALPPGHAQGKAPLALLEIDVGDDHAETMELTYDGLRALTRYDGLCLPAGARETRVHDGNADVQYEAREENGRRTLSFVARSSAVHVEMQRPAPSDIDQPLYSADANFCVPSGSRVDVVVRVPSTHTLFFMSDGAEVTPREGVVHSDGPTHVFYAYEAPPRPARPVAVFDDGPFRVFVPEGRVNEAREVAGHAARALAAALDEAGIASPFDTIRVLYSDTTPLAWEAGHYNGHGYILVKRDTLDPDRTKGYPLVGARILVHEAFHAASLPFGKGPVEDAIAWWLEGTAKHAERHADAVLPNVTHHCETAGGQVTCWEFDDRITRAALESGYAPTFAFDAHWEPSLQQTDDTRRFYYSYSEYVVGAYIARHGVERYRATWDTIHDAFNDKGCPCAAGWLERQLDDDLLFRPWQDVKETRPTEFEDTIRPFVKDENALEQELAARTNPLSGVPGPAWWTIAGLAGALAIARGRRPA